VTSSSSSVVGLVLRIPYIFYFLPYIAATVLVKTLFTSPDDTQVALRAQWASNKIRK